jgi:ABC-type nitrate/sulfonate/bicarbonate transport system permease component
MVDSRPFIPALFMASIVSNVSTLVESGLRQPVLERRRTLALRIGEILGFLALWSALAGFVVALRLFNPIFLPGPWLVLGSLVKLGAKGQLWIHVGYLAPVRNVVEPLMEMLRPIPPLAMRQGPA